MSFQRQKKIIIYGFNEYTEAIIQSIDKEKCKIIACIDYTNVHVNRSFEGIEIISGQQLFSGNYKYDYIVNGEMTNFVLFEEMIQKGYVHNANFFNYMKLLSFTSSISSSEFFLTYNNFNHSNKNFEGLITGLSYAQLSIECSALSRNFFNFASPSQDLFYDFEMMKFAYQHPNVKKNLKYVIIGLSYYSFEYDLSLSINSWRSCYYYPIVGTVHNLQEKDNFIHEFNFLSELGKDFLHTNNAEIVCKCLEENYVKLYQNSRTVKYDFQAMNNQEKITEVGLILQDFNKSYPETVQENIKILKKYLEFLIEAKITPIIVVSPSAEIYNLLASQKMKNEFYEIIDDLKKQCHFQFLDYCNSKDFEDKHFTNASHMNLDGALKFTKMLESDIKWEALPNDQQEIIGQILNLLPTIDEALQHMLVQLDNMQIKESYMLFKDISKAISSITKSLSPILTVPVTQDFLPYIGNLQQGINQAVNAFEIEDLIAVKVAMSDRVIPFYNVWKDKIKKQGIS